jgi:hypothetical protein
MNRIQLPWMKSNEQVGLGDLVQQFVDPSHKYIGCPKCRARQQLLNSLLTFTGTVQPPVQQQQPKPRPSDWMQQYGATSEEDLPDGGA